jgi:hypothetical protein
VSALKATTIDLKLHPRLNIFHRFLFCALSWVTDLPMWKSLMSSKGLLQGLIWRIGDGRSIKIWQDRWLPTPTSYTVQSHPRVIPDSCTVSMLIDHEVCGWNSGLIIEIFNPEEAKVIVTLPLCPTLPPDRLVWKGTTNGIFSVRSANHMGMEVKCGIMEALLKKLGVIRSGLPFGGWGCRIMSKNLCGERVMTSCPQNRIYTEGKLWKMNHARVVVEMLIFMPFGTARQLKMCGEGGL